MHVYLAESSSRVNVISICRPVAKNLTLPSSRTSTSSWSRKSCQEQIYVTFHNIRKCRKNGTLRLHHILPFSQLQTFSCRFTELFILDKTISASSKNQTFLFLSSKKQIFSQ